MADISVVIINDDGAEYLPGLWKSVKGQVRIPDIEWIFIDNCSKDGSLQWANNVGPLKVFRFEQRVDNRGILYNRGHQLAQSPYVLFVHSDIYFFPDFFEKLVEKLISQAADGVVMFPQYYPDMSTIGPERIGIDFENGELYYWQLFKNYPERVEWLIDCSEACFLVNREIFGMIRFEEDFQNSFYDHVLAARVDEVGKSVKLFTECQFGHYFIELHEKIKTLNLDMTLLLHKLSGMLVKKMAHFVVEHEAANQILKHQNIALKHQNEDLKRQNDKMAQELICRAEIIESMRLKNRAKNLIKKVSLVDCFRKKEK